MVIRQGLQLALVGLGLGLLGALVTTRLAAGLLFACAVPALRGSIRWRRCGRSELRGLPDRRLPHAAIARWNRIVATQAAPAAMIANATN